MYCDSSTNFETSVDRLIQEKVIAANAALHLYNRLVNWMKSMLIYFATCTLCCSRNQTQTVVEIIEFLGVEPATHDQLRATELIAANHGLGTLGVDGRLTEGLQGCHTPLLCSC